MKGPAPEYVAELVQRTWDSLLTTGEWLPEFGLLVELSDRGISSQSLVGDGALLQWQGRPAVLRAMPRGLLANEDFVRFMTPFPEFCRTACAQWVKSGGSGIMLVLEDVARSWDADAVRALNVLSKVEMGPISDGGSTGPAPEQRRLHVAEEILKFGNVQTLSDCLAAMSPRSLLPRVPLTDVHSELARRIWHAALVDCEWPSRRVFAAANRELGFVPELVEQMRGNLVRDYSSEEIRLNFDALAIIDSDGEGRRLLANIVRTVSNSWAQEPGQDVPVPRVASLLGLDERTVRAWSLFLDAPWFWGAQTLRGLSFHVYQPEKLLRFRRVSSWEECLQIEPPVTWLPSEASSADDNVRDAEVRELSGPTIETRLAGRGLILGELLGRGGMADVFRASHKILGPVRAVKILSPNPLLIGGETQMRRVVERFRRESQVLGRIRSSNVVRLVDVDLDHEPPFIVTEIVEGVTLSSLVREGAPPVDDAVAIIQSILDGLDAVHAQKVLHRDITPKNVIWDAATRRAVLIDFGLSGFFDISQEERLTTMSPPGTPGFTAPELLANPGLEDPVIDLFSATAVLHFLLTGRPPDLGAPGARLRAANVDAGLTELVLGGIAEERRYTSVAAMRAALLRIAPTRPSPSVPAIAPATAPSLVSAGSPGVVSALRIGAPDRVLQLGEFFERVVGCIGSAKPEPGKDQHLKVLAAYEGTAPLTAEFCSVLRVALEVANFDEVLAKLVVFFEVLRTRCETSVSQVDTGRPEVESDVPRLMLRELFLVAVDSIMQLRRWELVDSFFSTTFHADLAGRTVSGDFTMFEMRVWAPKVWNEIGNSRRWISPLGQWLHERFQPARLGLSVSFSRIRTAEFLASLRSLTSDNDGRRAWLPLCAPFADAQPLWLFERARTKSGAKALAVALGFGPSDGALARLKEFWAQRGNWPFEFFPSMSPRASTNWLRVEDIAAA